MDNFIKMLLNFLSILLLVKSLGKVNLIIFILILNMNPIIISFLNIRESNKTFNSKDIICYFLFILICFTEFFNNNKISMICTFLLIAINTFIITKLNKVNDFHPYITIFGTSLIGACLSPIIMVLNRDFLHISFTQYIFFVIISLTLFFRIYFNSKHGQYPFGKEFQIISSIFLFLLFIIYSSVLLRENNFNTSYIFIVFSFIVNVYAIFRNDSKN